MKRLLCLLFAALALLLLLVGCAKEAVTPNWAGQEKSAAAEKTDASGWQAQYDLGVRYLNDGNYEEAVIAFTAAIEIDPKRPEGYAARGGAYLSMAQASGDAAQYAQAADDLEQAGRLGDGSAGRREELAAAYIALGREEDAAEEYLALIEGEPRSEYFDWLIDYYRGIGDDARADEISRQAYAATGDEKYWTPRLSAEEAEALRAYTAFLSWKSDWAFAVADLDGDGVVELIAGESAYGGGEYNFSTSNTLTFNNYYYVYAYQNGDVCQVADGFVAVRVSPEIYITDTGAVLTNDSGNSGYYGSYFRFWNGSEAVEHDLGSRIADWNENDEPIYEYMIDDDLVSEAVYEEWLRTHAQGKHQIYPVLATDENLLMLTRGDYTGLSDAGQVYLHDCASCISLEGRTELEAMAREVSEQYGVGVYMVTTYYNLGDKTAEEYFEEYALGMGSEREAIMLLVNINIERREYDLLVNGSAANRVFTDNGKQVLAESFTDDLASDNWYNGLLDYIRECARFLEADANGAPVDAGRLG